MKFSDFDYDLPYELIAQYPQRRREGSRLMLVDTASESIEHRRFRDLPDLLAPDDLLVLNDTKVFPARLYAKRAGSKDKLEVLLLRQFQGDVWDALIRPGRKVHPGNRLIFAEGCFEGQVLEGPPSAVRQIRFEYIGDFWIWVKQLGSVPLPPYIKRLPGENDGERYQTVFARVTGSVAAPTAGLHFTRDLLQKVPHCEITLHVGYGTFKPISGDRVEQHQMDAEYYEIGPKAAARIRKQLQAERRVIAVGTTTTRALEHVFRKHSDIVADSGWTELFICPGFQFRVVRGLVTNFHLPRSTLLLLVLAFGGQELTLRCYREAVDDRYRFYSYGDVMLIL